MASVAATVSTGTFKRPILLSGTKQLTATPLPGSTVDQLKQMMQAVDQPAGPPPLSGSAPGLRQDRDGRHPGPGAAE